MEESLDLEIIADEILDEIFDNADADNNDTVENLIINETNTEEISPSENSTIKPPIYHEKETNEVLIKKIRDGIDVKKNRDALILQNSGLVFKEARLNTCNIPFQDKVQYGYEGLIKAVDSYDINRIGSTSFSTYAGVSISIRIYRFGNRDARAIEIPEYLSLHNITIQNYINKVQNKEQRTPSEIEISTNTGIALNRVKRALCYTNQTISIYSKMGQQEEEGRTLLEVLTASGSDYNLDENSMNTSFEEALELAFKNINPHDRILISLVHGLDGLQSYTLDEILDLGYVDSTGRRIYSKPTLSRRYTSAIESLKRILKNNNVVINEY